MHQSFEKKFNYYSVPHYANNKATGFMKVGHTFTIEPMINQGTYQDITWPDEWTAVN